MTPNDRGTDELAETLLDRCAEMHEKVGADGYGGPLLHAIWHVLEAALGAWLALYRGDADERGAGELAETLH